MTSKSPVTRMIVQRFQKSVSKPMAAQDAAEVDKIIKSIIHEICVNSRFCAKLFIWKRVIISIRQNAAEEVTNGTIGFKGLMQ